MMSTADPRSRLTVGPGERQPGPGWCRPRPTWPAPKPSWPQPRPSNGWPRVTLRPTDSLGRQVPLRASRWIKTAPPRKPPKRGDRPASAGRRPARPGAGPPPPFSNPPSARPSCRPMGDQAASPPSPGCWPQNDVRSAQAAEQQVKAEAAYLSIRSPPGRRVILPQCRAWCGGGPAAAFLLTLLDPPRVLSAASVPQGISPGCAWGNGPGSSWIRSQPTLAARWWEVDAQASFTPETIYSSANGCARCSVSRGWRSTTGGKRQTHARRCRNPHPPDPAAATAVVVSVGGAATKRYGSRPLLARVWNSAWRARGNLRA